MINKRIGIIGCGNMGEAIFRALSKDMEKSTMLMVSELDQKRRDEIQSKYHIIVTIDNDYLVKNSDVIIIAVKPQNFDSVLKGEIDVGASSKKLIISIAAGVTTGYIEGVLGKDVPVIRVMPNLPATIGEAISSISKGSSATKEDVEVAKEIFSSIGEVVEIEEKLVDAVTAISGSGPAYFFYMMETLIEAAEELGIDKDNARKLVLETALGSAKLIESLKEEPQALRKRVTSKGGTTEAAFKVIDDRKMKAILKDAVKKAHARSKELSRG